MGKVMMLDLPTYCQSELSFAAMKTLAERLIWARERKGLNRTQVAAAAGVTSSAISHLESGLRKSARNIVQIANALGVDPSWLSDGKGSPDPATAPAVAPAPSGRMQLVYVDNDELDLLTAYREADEPGRDFIRKAARVGSGSPVEQTIKNGNRHR